MTDTQKNSGTQVLYVTRDMFHISNPAKLRVCGQYDNLDIKRDVFKHAAKRPRLVALFVSRAELVKNAYNFDT